jgi:TonB family protein
MVPAQPVAPKGNAEQAEITEDQLKQLYVGKQLLLRGSYLGDSLSFNEHGLPIGHPTPLSFTLSAVQIDRVRLTKHRVEFEGNRYALHFFGGLPGEDPSKTSERVKITPKKKSLRISVDREQVIRLKGAKEEKPRKSKSAPKATPAAATPSSTDETAVGLAADQSKSNATPTPATGEPAPAAEPQQAADPASQTTTSSTAHANQVLREALAHVFASDMDESFRAHLPAFWQLYFQAQAAGVDYRPSDPKVFRSGAVEQQAQLLTAINPGSTDLAQANGIAGTAHYRVVVGSDGLPGEIAILRPIGFGLDEVAVEAIRKAAFAPASKGGEPVAEAVDLAVMFRIYSKRTATSGAAPQADDAQPKPVRPGPYSVKPPQP